MFDEVDHGVSLSRFDLYRSPICARHSEPLLAQNLGISLEPPHSMGRVYSSAKGDMGQSIIFTQRATLFLGALLFLIATPVVMVPQQLPPPPSTSAKVMILAVSRDDSVLAGGISTGKIMPDRQVDVEPLAWLSSSGEWSGFRCTEDHPKACKTFDRDYLKKPHTYSVVSGDGRGAIVKVKHMALDHECFGYGGQGTYSGTPINYAGVATSSSDFFTGGDSARRLDSRDADPVRKAFAATVGKKLDSMKELRVYSLSLEGQELFAVQRAFQDYGSTPGRDVQLNFIFAIGRMSNGRFHMLSWQNRVDNDENEQILGMIHLRNGRDFLVNTVSHPEGQYFRVYGIRDGKPALVYWGGGGGC
jgi:hypothetical protein